MIGELLCYTNNDFFNNGLIFFISHHCIVFNSFNGIRPNLRIVVKSSIQSKSAYLSNGFHKSIMGSSFHNIVEHRIIVLCELLHFGQAFFLLLHRAGELTAFVGLVFSIVEIHEALSSPLNAVGTVFGVKRLPLVVLLVTDVQFVIAVLRVVDVLCKVYAIGQDEAFVVNLARNVCNLLDCVVYFFIGGLYRILLASQ